MPPPFGKVGRDPGIEAAGRRIGTRDGLELHGVVLLGVRRRIAAVVPAHHAHRDAVAERDGLAAVHRRASIVGHLLRLRLQAGRLRSDDARARQPRPGRGVEGMIEVGVAVQKKVDARRPAQRRHDPRDGRHVGHRRARLRQAASPARKQAPGDPRDVPVGQDPQRTELVVDVRHGHPGDVHVRRSGRAPGAPPDRTRERATTAGRRILSALTHALLEPLSSQSRRRARAGATRAADAAGGR